ncbi:MAG: MogA/MoaB family molybdenum cofactor biosynthesis protein, partial [Actinobacteria bacterium]|nr:MogA/MoaB family molybdenum cofactor biosynthesis protein [Actinomycetota bacterium]
MSARVAVVTVPDRAASGARGDVTGPALAGAVRSAG